MGGTPLSELYIVYRKLAQICSEQNIQIELGQLIHILGIGILTEKRRSP